MIGTLIIYIVKTKFLKSSAKSVNIIITQAVFGVFCDFKGNVNSSVCSFFFFYFTFARFTKTINIFKSKRDTTGVQFLP